MNQSLIRMSNTHFAKNKSPEHILNPFWAHMRTPKKLAFGICLLARHVLLTQVGLNMLEIEAGDN